MPVASEEAPTFRERFSFGAGTGATTGAGVGAAAAAASSASSRFRAAQDCAAFSEEEAVSSCGRS